MDAFLPGVEGWEPIYNNPAIWHFRFNGPTPEAFVAWREISGFGPTDTQYVNLADAPKTPNR